MSILRSSEMKFPSDGFDEHEYKTKEQIDGCQHTERKVQTHG